jgi:UDP-N-acetylglucosamine/UDP-N-acetylgalactosamine 4-epimerase
MVSAYEACQAELHEKPRKWVVTGAAGFIGSNLVQSLLQLGQTVTGLDNFSLGKRSNLEEVRSAVGAEAWERFTFVEGDIRSADTCRSVCDGSDVVLHQAAMGSVPRSLKEPATYHESNVTGHLHMLLAARDARVHRFVYASSSSVYGDQPALPKQEEAIGNCLSPYAATKRIGEIYSDVIARAYGLEAIGLRYFNVFGPHQDPEGAYAAVIPKWIGAMMAGEPVYINGTGETSRDFCYIRNVVQMNLLAGTTEEKAAVNQVYNVAVSGRTTLNELFVMLRDRLAVYLPRLAGLKPVYRDFRAGDILHSKADISKAEKLLGYRSTHDLGKGLDEALPWYRKTLQPQA